MARPDADRPSRRHIVPSLVAALLLAGCASFAQKPRVDAQAIDRFVATGYVAPRVGVASDEAIAWNTADSAVSARLLVPSHVAPAPLIVYLPGLGQAATADCTWTHAWAEAGYAVLSIQPLVEDAEAWTSADARRGEFDVVARHRLAAPAMQQRLSELARTIATLKARTAAFPRLAAIDWTRIVLAGYDVGATTVMVAAGEAYPGVEPVSLPIRPRAVLALGPLEGGIPRGELTTRYEKVGVPALWVGGRNESTVYGAAAQGSARDDAFEALPRNGSALLLLADGTHRQIAGEVVAEPPVDADEDRRIPAARAQRSQRDSVEEAAQREAEMRALLGERDGRSGADAGAVAAARSLTMTQRALGVAAIRTVTTAYLDAVVRDEPAARDWLRNAAGPWLGPVARLRLQP
ncbi:MAG TPA: hypothetical protein VMU33_13660 [Burkholderiaceae bacterium]|nr:hypothetical protein [Burkholderiaceae bacterium]